MMVVAHFSSGDKKKVAYNLYRNTRRTYIMYFMQGVSEKRKNVYVMLATL